MCECGCSSFHPQFKMPGPDGKWYLLMVYPGCKNCDSPVGVDIQLIGPRVAKRDWEIDVDAVPYLPLHGKQPACGSLAVLHPSILRRKFTAALVGLEVDGGKVDEVGASVAMDEAFDEHFEDAVRETQANPLDEPDKRAAATVDG